MTTSVDRMLQSTYADMDKDGMFPQDWQCQRCGKTLNADGDHPAELYAGTFNGLCYPCTLGPRYVTGTRLVDGGTVWNYPPHCPSWRRSRETHVFYWDCELCHGEGQRSSYDHPVRCDACSKRSYTYGPGHDHNQYRRRARDAAQTRFERRLAKHLKLPKRTSKKRRDEAFKAFQADDINAFKEIQFATFAEWKRVDAAIDRRAERRGTYKILTPAEVVTALLAVLRPA